MRKSFVLNMFNFDVFHPATRVFVCCSCMTHQHLNICDCGMLLWTLTVDWALQGFAEGGLMRLIPFHNCFVCCPIMVVNNKFSLLLLVWGSHLFWACSILIFSPCCKGVGLLFLYDSSASQLLWLWDVVVDFDCELGFLGLCRGQFNETHTLLQLFCMLSYHDSE